jgi:hypothetical protein
VYYFEDDKLEPRVATYLNPVPPVHNADEVVLRLSRAETVVLMELLMRFRDQNQLATEHPAEEKLLHDLAALVQRHLQKELSDPAWAELLDESRQAVLAGESESRAN